MDISYALAIEDHARIDPLQGLAALAEKIVPAGPERERVLTQSDVKNQNEQSLAALQAMMGGVQGIAPQKKPRRAK